MPKDYTNHVLPSSHRRFLFGDGTYDDGTLALLASEAYEDGLPRSDRVAVKKDTFPGLPDGSHPKDYLVLKTIHLRVGELYRLYKRHFGDIENHEENMSRDLERTRRSAVKSAAWGVYGAALREHKKLEESLD